jgi:hypothetical protein
LDNFLYKSISFPFKASQFSLANQNWRMRNVAKMSTED